MDLLALPAEVLYQVFDFLREDGDVDSLLASLLVCHALQGIVESALYHTIAFRKRTSMLKLARALEADPRRLRYVQDLELAWSSKAYRDDEDKAVKSGKSSEIQPPDLSAMVNLRRLLSESPECQPWARGRAAEKRRKWKPDMQNALDAFEKASLRSNAPAPRPLEHLRSLTLHWSGEEDRFWSVKPSCPIFLHPTLRDIKLSCVCIVRLEKDDPEWSAGLDAFRHRTVLESLHFEESLVSSAALVEILSLPTALQHFEFEEVSYHRPHVGKFIDELIGHNADTLNTALAQQEASLRHLRIKSSSYLRQGQPDTADIALTLGGFRNLTLLELGGFPASRRSQPWMLVYPLPPNLTQLRVTGFGPDTFEAATKTLLSMLKVDQLIRSAQARGVVFELEILLPKIPFWESMPLHASMSQLAPITSVISDPAIFGEPQTTPAFNTRSTEEQSIQQTRAERVESRLPRPHTTIKSVKLGGNYIPPYLHGERRPYVITIFDSQRMVFSSDFLLELGRELHSSPSDNDELSSGEDSEIDFFEGEETVVPD